MNETVNAATRQRLLVIRSRFRELLEVDGGRPLRNKAVFYSGASSSVQSFCSWLGTQNPSFVGATNLEALPAGAYLQSLTPELKRLFGTDDFDKVQTFALPSGASFSASINGMWRELSARYAKASSGVVHVLVSHDRALLHRASIEFWAKGRQNSMLPKALKVFGFVELPILVGMLAENNGVTAVNIYVEDQPSQFSLVAGGQLLIGQKSGTA
jgi:hypothetical protein